MQQTYSCPNCGAQVAFGARFCTSCGTPLNWPTQQQTQPPPVYQQPQQPIHGYRQERPEQKKTSPWLMGCLASVGIVVVIGGLILAYLFSRPPPTYVVPNIPDVTLVEPPTYPLPSSNGGITLADASILLDMSADLPARFQHVDAASEGMSNEDLGLGADFSELEVFLSDEPIQMVWAMLYISESELAQATADTLVGDEELLKAIIVTGLQEVAVEEDIEVSDIETRFDYPAIGDLCVLATGSFSTYGIVVGFDFLLFRNDTVYVYLYSSYIGESVPLVPIATSINERIEALE